MATNASPLTLAYRANIYAQETKYEIVKQLRNRMYSIFAIGFPVMFYLLFGVATRHSEAGGISMAKYLLASYCTFGVMGAALFGVGVNIAIERSQGWLELKQASPMPPLALLTAKCLSSVTFGLAVTALLVLCGITLADVHISVREVLELAGIIAAGAIPFGALGLIFGLLAPANAAPGLVNLIYLPMAFCSGLWIPIMYLPHWVQKVALWLPSYHLTQLAFRALGFSLDQVRTSIHWEALAGFTIVFLMIGGTAYRRANMKG